MFNNSVTPLLIWIITIALMFRSQCVDGTTCDPNPCKNEGTCSGAGDCACAPGWGGTTCEEVSCKKNPCLLGGTCADSTKSIVCTCINGNGGDRCELVPQCKDDSECEHDGTCNKGSGQYVCDCTPGYGGDTCELAPKCTDAEPCENGGTCKADTTGRHICFCAPGFGGDLCADASGASTILGHFLLLTVVAVLAKVNLN